MLWSSSGNASIVCVLADRSMSMWQGLKLISMHASIVYYLADRSMSMWQGLTFYVKHNLDNMLPFPHKMVVDQHPSRAGWTHSGLHVSRSNC